MKTPLSFFLILCYVIIFAKLGAYKCIQNTHKILNKTNPLDIIYSVNPITNKFLEIFRHIKHVWEKTQVLTMFRFWLCPCSCRRIGVGATSDAIIQKWPADSGKRWQARDRSS